MKGAFISFEGIEGTGKTTQTRLLAEHLRSKGLEVVETAEPGGTKIGRRIREILLAPEHDEMHHLTELLLYNASRVQHLQQVILPALARDAIVITDRFSDSTLAYQGFGRGIDPQLLISIDRVATGHFLPALTILLDIDVAVGLSRNRRANKTDRLEQEDVAFHERVRKGFIQLATREPERIRRVDCSPDAEHVHRAVISIVDAFLAARTA